jgi:hypothetical protein
VVESVILLSVVTVDFFARYKIMLKHQAAADSHQQDTARKTAADP